MAVGLFQILYVPLGLVWGIVGNKIYRREEYRADRFAAENTDPQWTISGLKSMHRENLVNLTPHPLSVLLYASHPTLGQRIRALGREGVKGSTAGLWKVMLVGAEDEKGRLAAMRASLRHF